MSDDPHVPKDHFLRQFDRFTEGEDRLAAAAAHCAHLFNALTDERAQHTETLRSTLDALCEASPVARLARDLADQLHERREL